VILYKMMQLHDLYCWHAPFSANRPIGSDYRTTPTCIVCWTACLWVNKTEQGWGSDTVQSRP